MARDENHGGPGTLTLSDLACANAARQDEWCVGGNGRPDLSYRGNELAGETGEACNVIKKLERERHGWRGSRATVDQLAQELADVVICADLCATAAGVDLSQAVVDKFNADSDKIGLKTKLCPSPVPTAGAAVAGVAEGCCSAISPCSHQQRGPTTICEICQKAAVLTAKIAAAPSADDEEARELAASERISAAQVAYDEAMEDYDPTAPDHEVQAFDAMKAAIAAADALAPVASRTEVGREEIGAPGSDPGAQGDDDLGAVVTQLLERFEWYQASSLSHYDAHNCFVGGGGYKLWEALERAYRSRCLAAAPRSADLPGREEIARLIADELGFFYDPSEVEEAEENDPKPEDYLRAADAILKLLAPRGAGAETRADGLEGSEGAR